MRPWTFDHLWFFLSMPLPQSTPAPGTDPTKPSQKMSTQVTGRENQCGGGAIAKTGTDHVPDLGLQH